LAEWRDHYQNHIDVQSVLESCRRGNIRPDCIANWIARTVAYGRAEESAGLGCSSDARSAWMRRSLAAMAAQSPTIAMRFILRLSAESGLLSRRGLASERSWAILGARSRRT